MTTGDSIAAIATPPGRGGIGIIRVSGQNLSTALRPILGELPQPRTASYRKFLDHQGQIIDEGLVLYFPAPNSFTGEDVIELQGHGGPVILDMLLEEILKQGMRIARPGEFSERAFLNDRIDLVQAEAIADLIDSSSRQAARLAQRSFQGVFSKEVNQLVDAIIELRAFVEAAIDFPEEEVDFLSDAKINENVHKIDKKLNKIHKNAEQGALLRDGMQLVIAGKPNAGKSSLLNALSGRETAIVTAVEGTTRDLLREQIHIDGMPVHLIDTAGFHKSDCEVEQIGIAKAREEINRADMILWVYDAEKGVDRDKDDIALLPKEITLTLVQNKIDKLGGSNEQNDKNHIRISAKTGQGIDVLRQHLKAHMHLQSEETGEFIARRRHLDALAKAQFALVAGRRVWEETKSGELLAEELRQMQNELGGITGVFTADDLLGEIFSSFCIGK